jgi:hypothetical protein
MKTQRTRTQKKRQTKIKNRTNKLLLLLFEEAIRGKREDGGKNEEGRRGKKEERAVKLFHSGFVEAVFVEGKAMAADKTTETSEVTEE